MSDRDPLELRLLVRMSAIITLSATSQITRQDVAENLDQLIHSAGGIETFVDSTSIEGVTWDGEEIIE